ncbi:MAG: PaaI family thioesterase [Gammaproteobacteria bacterium]
MTTFVAAHTGFEASVRESFSRMTLMTTIGARLVTVAAGQVHIDMAARDELTQQHGYVAGAIVTAIVDTACGFAAMSLMPAGAGVLTVECKVNFLSPARGERLLARGWVVKPGRTLTVCAGEVHAVSDGTETIVAALLATMMSLPDVVHAASARP